MTLQVRVLRRAQADVDDIYLWLRNRSRVGAASWYASFRHTLDNIAASATPISQAPEAAKLAIDLRQALFKTRRGRTYRLLFVVIGDEARVLRVRGPGQRPVTRRDIPRNDQ